MNRRAFILGAAALVAGGSKERLGFAAPTPTKPKERQAAAFNYKKISQAPVGEWFNVRPENGDGFTGNWSAGVALMKSSTPGAQMFDSGEIGKLNLNSTNVAEFFVKPDPAYLYQIQGNGVRAMITLEAHPKQKVELLSIDSTTPQVVATVQADDSGYVGLFIPNSDKPFGVRVNGTYTFDKPLVAKFGELNQYPNPIKRSEIDVASPDWLTRLPMYQIDQAPSNTVFRPETAGVLWSPSVSLALPERSNGLTYFDQGRVGQLFISSPNQTTFDLYMDIDPRYLNDYRDANDLANTHPNMWVSSSRAGTKMELLDINRNVIAGAEKFTDGVGQGAVRLALLRTTTGVRFTLPPPVAGVNQLIELNFGPERPADRGKASTLDATQFIVNKPLRLPWDVKAANTVFSAASSR